MLSELLQVSSSQFKETIDCEFKYEVDDNQEIMIHAGLTMLD